MFSQVSVCPQGGRVCLWSQGGLPHTHTPGQTHPHTPGQTPPRQTPPGQTPPGRHTHPGQTPSPRQTHTSWADTPIECWDTPHPVHAGIHIPPAQCMLGYCQQAGVRIPLECILFLNQDMICIIFKCL